MEDAVREKLGELTAEVAAEILCNRRSELPYANEWNVANLHAPFGEYVPFPFAKNTKPPSIPGSKLLTEGGLDRERREIDQVHEAQRLHHERKHTQAQAAWKAAFAMDLKTPNIAGSCWAADMEFKLRFLHTRSVDF